MEALARARSSSPAAAHAGDRTPGTGNSGRRLLALFMSREPASEEYFAQLASLAAQGYAFTAAFSRTFEQTHSIDAVLSMLPPETPRLTGAATEPELLQAGVRCQAVVAHAVSANTAAKVAQGMDDSLPALLLRQALLGGKPVFIGHDLPRLERELAESSPAAPPALIRATVDAFHRLQNVGARFVESGRLAAEVAAAFHQPVNETPARLARTKPSPRRVFITAEDVWSAAARGLRELPHPPDAIVTDAARDEALARGIQLVVR